MKLSILVTDDNASQRSHIIGYLCYYFGKAKVHIDEALDGEQAITLVTSKIKQEKVSYDLIIMDFEMPNLNGQKATLQIRELEKNLPGENMSKIITWSSAWETPFIGADISLKKRFSPMEFAKTLSALGYEQPN